MFWCLFNGFLLFNDVWCLFDGCLVGFHSGFYWSLNGEEFLLRHTIYHHDHSQECRRRGRSLSVLNLRRKTKYTCKLREESSKPVENCFEKLHQEALCQRQIVSKEANSTNQPTQPTKPTQIQTQKSSKAKPKDIPSPNRSTVGLYRTRFLNVQKRPRLRHLSQQGSSNGKASDVMVSSEEDFLWLSTCG